MSHLKSIGRQGNFQINYEMSDGIGSSFRADREVVDLIDIAFGGVELQGAMHPGMTATNKYLKAVYEKHGAQALHMIVDSIVEDALKESAMKAQETIPIDELDQHETCPRCQEQVALGEVCERYSVTGPGGRIYAGKFCKQCCYGYIDNCGLDRPYATQADVDEPVEPE
jgi:hypothetical protein